MIKKRKILCVKGNHDFACVSGDVHWFNPLAADAILKTIGMLSKEEIKFLDSLPEKIELKLNDYKIYLVHGSPRDPIWEYVFEEDDLKDLVNYANSDILAMGHTHVPFVKRINNKLVINVGAVGQPRDHNPKACFCLLNLEKFDCEIARIEYDVKIAAEKIIKIGFPKFLAQRLFLGI